MFKWLVLGAGLSLVTLALAASENETRHDLFVASDKSLALTLNIANNSDDIFFSFIGPDSSSWISFGLGSDLMNSAIMFLVYASSSGTNITLSPRLPIRHAEPEYSSDIHVELLDDSGIQNGMMIANFKCSNCRGTKAAKIANYNFSANSTTAKMCFASGPSGIISSMKSDDLNAAISRHSSFGSFTMDMIRATGIGGVATVPITAISANTTLDDGSIEKTYKKDGDMMGILHAAIMLFTFIVLMPFGVVVLRIMGLVKWHGINQGVAMFLTLVGTALGVSISKAFNRSKNFNTAHQIVGIIIFLAVVVQFTLGFMHHRVYKKTQSTTKMAPIHVWMGRAIFPAAIIDALLGFPLALSTRYNYWLSGFIVAVFLPLILVLIWKSRRNARNAKQAAYPLFTRDNGLASVQKPREQPAIRLQRIEQSPTAYNRGDDRHLTEFQVLPVEPFQRV